MKSKYMKDIKLNKYVREILCEMYKTIGVDFDEIRLEPNWFENYAWTEKQQNEFIEWLAGYLKAHQGARMGPERVCEFEIYASNRRSLLEMAKSIVFNYGPRQDG